MSFEGRGVDTALRAVAVKGAQDSSTETFQPILQGIASWLARCVTTKEFPVSPVRRALFRIKIAREGTVRRGSEVASCSVTELTTKGMGLSTDLRAAQGEQLEVTFALTEGAPICCQILVTHAIPPCLGGRITSISPAHDVQLTRFIDQHISTTLSPL